MPIRYEYRSDIGHLDILVSGEVSLQERVDCIRQILTDQSLPNQLSILVDVSGLNSGPNTDEVYTIAKLCDRLLERFSGKIAAFSTAPGMVTLDHLISIAMHQSHRVQVFTDLHEARRWL